MRRLSRAQLRRSAAATFLAAWTVLVLSGFIRIAFGPTQPDFAWRTATVNYVVSATGSDDVADRSEETAIRLAFRRWAEVPSGGLTLAEDPIADRSRRDYESRDIHLVLFDEDGSSQLFPPGSGIIALTPIIADMRDGTILDADIIFNGRDIRFGTRAEADRVDVQAVVNHEIGHFLGLDHSGGPRSTMFPAIAAGSLFPRGLGRDDEAFLATAYPRQATGTISGTVTLAAGGAVMFGHVVAVDAATGEVSGAGLTDGAGRYRLTGVRAGSHRVYVEPFDGPVLPADTIRLGSTAPTLGFATTWAPAGAVGVNAGAETSGVDISVAGSSLNAELAFGASLLAGGQARSVTVGGAGMDTIVAASVPGTGVTVSSILPATIGGDPAVRVTVQASASAARGIRPLELRDALGRAVIVTAAIQVLDAAPSIAAVAPNRLRGGEVVTIDGSGFGFAPFVTIGGLEATNVQVIAGTRLMVTAPSGDTAGTPVDVVVINPDGQEGRAVGAVTYEANPTPQVVDPTLGPLGGGTTHRITGTGFASPVAVTVAGRPSSNVLLVSATEVRFVLPAGAAVGPADVTLTSAGVMRTIVGGITYVDALAPVVDSFTPTNGPEGGGTRVTLSGRDFPTGARVLFGGSDATNLVVTPTRIEATTPAHAPGSVEVRVLDPASGLAGIAPASFVYEGMVVVAPSGGGGGGGGGCTSIPTGGSPLALLPLLVLLGLALGRR